MFELVEFGFELSDFLGFYVDVRFIIVFYESVIVFELFKLGVVFFVSRDFFRAHFRKSLGEIGMFRFCLGELRFQGFEFFGFDVFLRHAEREIAEVLVKFVELFARNEKLSVFLSVSVRIILFDRSDRSVKIELTFV